MKLVLPYSQLQTKVDEITKQVNIDAAPNKRVKAARITEEFCGEIITGLADNLGDDPICPEEFATMVNLTNEEIPFESDCALEAIEDEILTFMEKTDMSDVFLSVNKQGVTLSTVSEGDFDVQLTNHQMDLLIR